MGIGISTLSNFLLTKEGQEALVGFRLYYNESLALGKAKRLATMLAEALGPAWFGYAYTLPTGTIVMVVESAECHAL